MKAIKFKVLYQGKTWEIEMKRFQLSNSGLHLITHDEDYLDNAVDVPLEEVELINESI